MVYFRHMRGGFYLSGRSVRIWRRLRRFLDAPRDGGFTVIEVLIVLGVSATLFVSAAIMIAGRQNQTAFNQAIREVQSQIQQVVNEVSTGYFPDTNFDCTASGSGPVLSTVSSGGQGTKTGCIFLGKAIQFRVGLSDPEQFRVYTLAGLQKNSTGQEVSTYAEAQPKVVGKTDLFPSNPDISTTSTLQNGLSVYEMYNLNIAGTTKTNVSVVAFVNSLAAYNSGSIVSGSQQVNIVPVRNTWLGGRPEGIGDAINVNFAISQPNPTRGVNICFVSGTTDQSGLITIGSQNRDLAVRLDIKSNKTCS